ncbi:MAG: hypothetical protein ACYS0F_01125 [Planctomycetota bacterium]|jgi:hypothetical protein
MVRVLTPILIFAAAVAAKPIDLKKGRPSAKGLDQLVILTNYAGTDKRFAAVKKLAEYRKAKILRFKGSKVGSVRGKLARVGPEFVALAVKPETVDVNFHYDVLELCRGLDADPMPDFFFGYLCARDGKDLAGLIERIKKREATPPDNPAAKVVALSGTCAHLQGLDYFLHFGHGQAWRVDGGLTGEQVGALEFPKSPVVWSGACFNGVLSRSYHKCAYQLVFFKPTTIQPEHLMTLNWVHAGASGYFAAMEGDRGEMAEAEWEYFRTHACSLGEVIGHQYRLAFVSLPASFEKFPRYIPGAKKRMSFYNVMLRGMVSRILISDPCFRPLRRPLDQPVAQTEVKWDKEAKTLHVSAKVLRWSQGHFLNYLPKSGKGIFDRRFTIRVEIPSEIKGKWGKETVTVHRGPEVVELTRHHVRHEVWGNKRYLNLQAEMNAKMAGLAVDYHFPIGR